MIAEKIKESTHSKEYEESFFFFEVYFVSFSQSLTEKAKTY